MVTEAIPTGLRDFVPAKITSSMRAPRRLFADCSPRTQLMASLRLDLPHPLGPTTAAIPPPLNRSSVRSQKDLNPCSSTFLSFSKTCTSHASARGSETILTWVADESKVAAIQYSASCRPVPQDIVVVIPKALLSVTATTVVVSRER